MNVFCGTYIFIFYKNGKRWSGFHSAVFCYIAQIKIFKVIKNFKKS